MGQKQVWVVQLFVLSNNIFLLHTTKQTENWLFFSQLGQIHVWNINQGDNFKIRSLFTLVSITGRPKLPAPLSGRVIYLAEVCVSRSEGTASTQCTKIQI